MFPLPFTFSFLYNYIASIKPAEEGVRSVSKLRQHTCLGGGGGGVEGSSKVGAAAGEWRRKNNGLLQRVVERRRGRGGSVARKSLHCF